LAFFGTSKDIIDIQIHDTYFVLSFAVVFLASESLFLLILISIAQILDRFKSWYYNLFMVLLLFELIYEVYQFLGYQGIIVNGFRVTPYPEEPIYSFLRYFKYILVFLVALFFLNLIMLLRAVIATNRI
jgi:hypothetical protein